MSEFEDFLTNRIFQLLDEQSIKVHFDWFKMSRAVDEHYGRPVTAIMRRSRSNLYLTPRLLQNDLFIPDWEFAAQHCFHEFVSLMNHEGVQNGVEVGIYKFLCTPTIHDPVTLIPMTGIIYYIVLYDFGSDITKITKLRRPRLFTLPV